MGIKKSGFARPSVRTRDCVVVLTICTLTAQPVWAGTLPTAGSVVVGQVSIGTSGNTTTVTQGSHNAIVNWGSFSVGEGATVNFIQPDSSSAILNRVTGSTTSVIAGSINANGQVFLINPNGLAITSTGAIKVGGGFVGSTLNITDKDFLDGHLVFDGNGASAGVSNAGVISVGRDGYAALIGGTVKNKGLIVAPLGKIGLGSGEQATLDFSGDGFLQVALPTGERTKDNNALIDNQGTLSANGGTVLISVASARDAARHAINLSGVVEANSVSGHDGKIIIGGGEGGEVTVSGKVMATSDVGKGGEIAVTGKNITLNEATLDASGAIGGGSIKVGGDYQGKGITQRADTTRVDTNSVIRADAIQSGDGGKAIVWSNDLTTFDGQITARGAGAGKGGNAEVSGKANLAYNGFTDLSGPGGFGTLLLDPYNITISNDTASNSSGTSVTGDDSVINVDTLVAALGSANVTVTTGGAGSAGTQAGDITVANDVTWASGSTLELSAYRDINVNANLSGGTGSQIVLRSDNSGTGTGTVTFSSGAKATASGGVSLYYNPDSYTSTTDYSANMGDDTMGIAYMLVNNVDNLQAINANLAGNYALSNDIDADATSNWNDGEGFVPLGDNSTNSDDTRFTGIFDGQDHVISNLTIDRPSVGSVGLFGGIGADGNIRNVGLEGGSITGQGDVGGLAGRNAGTITNVYATGTVTANNAAGGLVGVNMGTISNAYATGAVSGVSSVGGLVGTNAGDAVLQNVYATGTVTGGGGGTGGLVGGNLGGTITNAYATGAVTGVRAVGGLVGHSGRGTILSNVYASGTVTASDYNVGGLVGQTDTATISNAYASGVVSGAYKVGGLIGYQLRGTTSNAYATGAVTGRTTYVGGLVGYSDSGIVSNSYATGAVKGGERTGGLVGFQFSGRISEAYATGKVTGSHCVGGLVGYSDYAPISYTYAIGEVSGSQHVGGLVGRYIEGSHQAGEIAITSSFWNKQTTRQSKGLGTSYLLSEAQVTGLTTAQMKELSRFSDWDIDDQGGTGAVWRIYDGYTTPLLRSFLTELSIIGGSSSKTYDGSAISTDVGTLTFSDANYDPSLVKGNLQAYYKANSANAGTYTGSSLELIVSGLYSPSQQGYDISTRSGSLTIDKASLTVSANDAAKTYDGQAFTGGNGVTYSGLVNNETGAVLGGALTYGGTSQGAVDAGSYAIDVSGLTSGNYDISYVPSQLTIDKAALTVTANDASKTYDGQAFTGGNGVTYSGLVNNETNSVLGGTLTYGGTSQGAVNAGSYAIDVSGLTSGNYDIAYVPGQLTIDKAALAVTANGFAKTYDGQAFTGGDGVTYSGLVNNETGAVLSGALTYGGTSQGAVDAGSYGIAVSGLTSGNYDIAYVPGQLTIDKAALTVTANGAVKTYDGQAFTGGNGVTYSGLVNNETSSVLGGTLTYGGTSQGAVDAGSYGIDVSGLTSGNYDIAYVPGQLTIDKAALTITANDAVKTYDGQAFTGGNGVTYSGLVNNETSSVLDGTLAYGGTSQGAINEGMYVIDVSGLASVNYDIAYVSGQLMVTAAP